MASEKVTLSMDGGSVSLARAAAEREGMSLSAWLSRVARREAVRAGAGPSRRADGGAQAEWSVQADALADEQERELAERHLREAG